MTLAIGDRVTGVIRGEFSAGTVDRLWMRGFVFKRDDNKTAVIHFMHDEGTTWVRGEASLDDRKAMKAALALRGAR